MAANQHRQLDIHKELAETTPLPPRRMKWRRAWHLTKQIKEHPYTPELSYDLILALDGGDLEQCFQDFLAEPGARQLIEERPNLAEFVADRDALAAMGEGSLGRAYLELTDYDGYSADSLIQLQDRLDSFREIAPDPIRKWFHNRGAVLHDVFHALTGYGRDFAGEAAVNVFTAAVSSHRITRLYSFIGALAAPRDNYLANLSYMREVWRRGRRSRIPLSARWEELFPLQLDEVCRRLQIPCADDAHPAGIMREAEVGGGSWVSVKSPQFQN